MKYSIVKSTLLLGICQSSSAFVSREIRQASNFYTTSWSMPSRKRRKSNSELEMVYRGGALQKDTLKLPLPGIKRDNMLSSVAVTADMIDDAINNPTIPFPDVQSKSSWSESFLFPILSSAMMITGNTLGAGCLVMPEVAAGPGFASTSAIFFGAYLVNLISGVAIAEVAIRQREASGNEVPSSFKEFAEANLNSPVAANAISSVSIFVNSCVMMFALSRAGTVGSSLLGDSVDPSVMSIGWAAGLMTLMLTQSSSNLSSVTSACVVALFVSFGGLLLPGLHAVSDPVGTLLQPGLSSDWMSSVSQAAPVILTSMIYQNIVPTITKNLNYDRTKTVASLVLGSMIPLVMYLSWCYASLGGGVDAVIGLDSGAGALLMSIFSIATLSGSSICSGLSISEELDNFFSPSSPTTEEISTQQASDDEVSERFQLTSVLVSVLVPLSAALAFANGDHDLTEILGLAGSFGSPLLYGILPAVMALYQRQNSQGQQQDMVPTTSLGALGLLSTAFVGAEFIQRIGDVLA